MRSIGILGAATLLLASSAAAQTTQRVTLDGNAVAVYNIAGAVTIEPGSGSDVVVEVTRRGADAGDLRVDRRSVEGRNALIVKYPRGTVVYPDGGGNTTIQVNDDGTFFTDEDTDISGIIGMIFGSNRVTVRSSGRGTQAHADLRILVPAGRSVDVRLGSGSVRAGNTEGNLDIDVANADVQVTGTRGRLRVDTGSGAVRVTNTRGDVLVDTGSGSVELQGVSGESVEVDTGSGDVRGSRVAAARFHVDTGSGDIEIADLDARDIECDTGSGSVTLSLVSQMERLLVDTGSGAVRIAVPEPFNASVEIDTGSGGIDVALPVNATTRERSRLVGTIGRGGPTLHVDTGSGGVRITRR